MAYRFGSAGTNTIDYGATDFVNGGGTGSYSIFARVLVNSASTAERLIVSQRGAAGIGETWFGFGTGATNQLTFGINTDGGTNFYESAWTSGWLAGTVHSAIGTYEGVSEALNIYADGDPTTKNSASIVGNRLAFNAPSVFTIGNKGQSGATVSFDGTICEVGIWYQVLTLEERTRLFRFNCPLAVPGGLRHYWSLRSANPYDERTWAAGTITGATLTNELPGVIQPAMLMEPMPWLGKLAAAGGRTTKNTRAWPLGTAIGMGWRMPA
jgi:hypothetical protein